MKARRRPRAPAASSAARRRSTASSSRSSGRTARRRAPCSRRSWRSSRTSRCSGQDQLLEEAAHGLRAPVPRDQDPEQQGEARRAREGEGRPEALARAAARDALAGREARRHPSGLLRLPLLRGRAGAAGRHARAAPARGRRADRAERRRQVDARERAHRLRPSRRRGRSSSDGRDITRWSAHRRARAGRRAHVPAQPLLRAACRCARTSRSRRSASARGRGEARRRADELLELLGLSRARASAADSLCARRRAPARRRARARHRAALRADGRAGGRPARGGGAASSPTSSARSATTTAPASC